MAEYFPVFIKTDPMDRVIMIGGGRTALGKLRVLMQFDIGIVLIAPNICDDIMDISDDRFTIVKEKYRSGMIETYKDHAVFVIAATDNPCINSEIHKECRELGLLLNSVDDVSRCDIIFPSILKRGSVVAAVSSGGKCPVITQYLRDRLAEIIPDDIEEIADELQTMRDELKEMVPDHKQRAGILRDELTRLLEER